MKKTIRFFAALLAIILTFSTLAACKKSDEKAVDDKYKAALSAIDSGEYEEAYKILKGLNGNKSAEKLLENFIFLKTEETEISYKECEHDAQTDKYTFKDEVGNTSKKYTYKFDKKGNVTEFASDYATITYKYDENGNMTERSGLGYTETYKYDSQNNLIASGRSDSSLYNTYTYDNNGNLIEEKIIDEFDGEVDLTMSYTYDSNNNCLSYTYDHYRDSEDTVTYYTYDANGKLLTKKEIEGNRETITTYTYDENGKLIKEEDDYDTTTYKYDQNDNLIEKRKGVCSEIYDKYGNCIEEVTYSSAMGRVYYVRTYKYMLSYVSK